MSEENAIIDHDCDLCGSTDAAEIACAPGYTDGQPIHVCRGCGFVYVRRRRSYEEISRAWSDELYETVYTARIPMVKARQMFTADFIDVSLGLAGKTVCDIGGGEGRFLQMVEADEYGATGFGIEPSAKNCELMTGLGIENFEGSIEDFHADAAMKDRRFDVATIMWTLEACQSCRGMMQAAYDLLEPGGHVVVATGSRILVPFKKPLQYYLGPNDADTHPFRFSENTLSGLMAETGFKMTHVNRYIDSDWMVMIGQKAEPGTDIPWRSDDPDAVLEFFQRWHDDTEAHYKGQ